MSKVLIEESLNDLQPVLLDQLASLRAADSGKSSLPVFRLLTTWRSLCMRCLPIQSTLSLITRAALFHDGVRPLRRITKAIAKRSPKRCERRGASGSTEEQYSAGRPLASCSKDLIPISRLLST